MRYLIKLAFNGKNYHGWQKQPNDKTVQSELEEKLSLLLVCNTEVTGCGRTETWESLCTVMKNYMKELS